MGRKWLSLFVCEGFVCFPVGQIYLGGRLSKVCRWKLATSRGCYTVTDSYSVMWLLRSRLQPNEKLISFICQQWRSWLVLYNCYCCVLIVIFFLSGHTSQVLSCSNTVVAVLEHSCSSNLLHLCT